jgi:phospholipid/cholesterol/gamma-HCH transport system permease protein
LLKKGRRMLGAVETSGDFAMFVARVAFSLKRGVRWDVMGPLLVEIGFRSIGVVLFTGCFIGMVLAVQAHMQLAAYGAATRLGQMVNLSVIRELGPVLAATMLAGRVGGSISAEIATMRMSEQVDALACLGVSPIRYLAVPRFLACLILVPVLTVFANFMGILGGAIVATEIHGIEPYHYWQHASESVDLWDHLMGLIKAFFFGGSIGLISCYVGLNATGGARGVGIAATRAFVVSFLTIMVCDFFLGLFFARITPTMSRLLSGGGP